MADTRKCLRGGPRRKGWVATGADAAPGMGAGGSQRPRSLRVQSTLGPVEDAPAHVAQQLHRAHGAVPLGVVHQLRAVLSGPEIDQSLDICPNSLHIAPHFLLR